MTDFETKYRDLVAGLGALADEWERSELLNGTMRRLAADLRALLASSPAERPETRCGWCGEPANGVADLPDGRTYPSCLMPQCDGLNPRKPAASPVEREGEAKCGCGATICADCGYCRGSEACCSTAPVSSGEAVALPVIHVWGFGDASSVGASIDTGTIADVANGVLDKTESFGHEVQRSTVRTLGEGVLREAHAVVRVRPDADPMWHRFFHPGDSWPRAASPVVTPITETEGD